MPKPIPPDESAAGENNAVEIVEIELIENEAQAAESATADETDVDEASLPRQEGAGMLLLHSRKGEAPAEPDVDEASLPRQEGAGMLLLHSRKGEAPAEPDRDQRDTQSHVADAEAPTAEIVEAVDPQSAADNQQPAEPQVPPIRNPAQGRAALECLLFLAVEPISLKRLSKHLPPLTEKEIRGLLAELQNCYDERGSGLQVLEVAGGFQLATRSLYSPWVFSLQKSRKRPALSPAALETLAIVAYKQPVTRAELEAIRGVDSSSLLRMLQDVEFVTVTGHKEVVGRPQLYGTTRKFLKAFGLASLNDLPSIAELKAKFGVREE